MSKLVVLFLFFTTYCFGSVAFVREEMSLFSGRVVSLNSESSLLKVRTSFSNLKYLNKKDRVQFWTEVSEKNKCDGRILGKSNDYLLIKIFQYKKCLKHHLLGRGFYLKFSSQDLVNNIAMGKEVVSILLKKKLALEGMKENKTKEVVSYSEMVDAVNSRYDLLRQKLEDEWSGEIANLELKKSEDQKLLNDLKSRLEAVNYKLERYRISDENMKVDRWSLDKREYIKK